MRRLPGLHETKTPTGAAQTPMRHVPTGLPMERVAVDVLGPLPLTKDGNLYILVLVEYFTKWAEAYPLPDQKA